MNDKVVRGSVVEILKLCIAEQKMSQNIYLLAEPLQSRSDLNSVEVLIATQQTRAASYERMWRIYAPMIGVEL